MIKSNDIAAEVFVSIHENMGGDMGPRYRGARRDYIIEYVRDGHGKLVQFWRLAGGEKKRYLSEEEVEAIHLGVQEATLIRTLIKTTIR